MPSLKVEKSNKRSGGVWAFFDDIRDVNDLDPAEEQGEAWECYFDGDLAGMIVVDTVPLNGVFINRVAVEKSYRRMGVASRLIEEILSKYSEVECRVHKDNRASQNLMESVGFSKDGMGRYEELIIYTNK